MVHATTPAVPSQEAKPSDTRKSFPKLARMLIAPTLWISALFAGAGTLNWPRGGASAVLYVIGMGSMGVFVRRRNPAVMEARSTWGSKGTKPFDRVFMAILMPLVFLHPAVAGMDAVRYGRSSMPVYQAYVGALLFALSLVIIGAALATNRHAETTVRIQTDRDHTVIDAGPYRYVRHPMYSGAILMYVATALIWGSVWAMAISCLISVLFVWRTHREDCTLRAELQGYDEYTTRTRYRLLPRVW